MHIAFIGSATGTSMHRAQALTRLGYQVSLVDPMAWLGKSKLAGRWLYKTGAIGAGWMINRRIVNAVTEANPDLIWVDQGAFLGPALILNLRSFMIPIVNYTIDDPFNGRDGMRFYQYIRSLVYYDLIVVVRNENIKEAGMLGAKRVMRVWRSADEIAHRPRILSSAQHTKFASEVAFIGTWMPERGPFMAELAQRGVPLSIWGNGWHKAHEWPQIRTHWRGPGLDDDESYAAAVQCARVCLGLLSKGNRDLHTTRSMEIPSLGGLLCAERTSEHQELYKEGSEVLMWNNVEECADLCLDLLADEDRLSDIRRLGHERAILNNHFNEPVMDSIIKAALVANNREK
jgi:hypothetical protein